MCIVFCTLRRLCSVSPYCRFDFRCVTLRRISERVQQFKSGMSGCAKPHFIPRRVALSFTDAALLSFRPKRMNCGRGTEGGANGDESRFRAVRDSQRQGAVVNEVLWERANLTARRKDDRRARLDDEVAVQVGAIIRDPTPKRSKRPIGRLCSEGCLPGMRPHQEAAYTLTSLRSLNPFVFNEHHKLLLNDRLNLMEKLCINKTW